VLLQGETGTGKDVLARHVHDRSGRPGPFVPVNCAALSTTLAESELFGHVRGAFTGAERLREGLFERAHQGTLLLDEIGDLDLVVQGKLLRILEDGEVQRLGSSSSFPVDVRIIAATHRDLPASIEQGRFREDLFQRLAGMTLSAPPLRQRREDIGPLVERFLTDENNGGGSRVLAPETLAWLERQSWRGNTRELRQAVRRAVALGGREMVPKDFGLEPASTRAACARPVEGAPAEKTWHEIEREAIVEAARRHGSLRAAAAALGRPKSTVHDRARRLGIGVPRPHAG
jgi:transcriptional regulator with GAF, ATPase, and Fis domain